MTDTHRDSRGRFLPGNKIGRGRAHGTRIMLGQALVETLAADFAIHGGEAVREVRESRPVDYVKICLSLLPKDYTLTINPIADLTDDELHTRLHQLNAVLAEDEGGATGGVGGDGAPPKEGELEPIPALPPPE